MTNNPAFNLFAVALHDVLNEMGIPETVEELENKISLCHFSEKGQVTFKVFPYARIIKGKSPYEIALSVSKKLQDHHNVVSVSAEGGYVNAFVNQESLGVALENQFNSNSGSVEYTNTQENQRILVEFSQPNTHKELHVGHARNIVLGDVLSRIFSYVGNEVYTENYHGDEGAHVAKCIWYINKNNLRPQLTENKGVWLGKMYRDATIAIEEAKGTEQEQLFQVEISNALEQIESRSGPYFELWSETREWSLDLFEEAYEWLGTYFDNWTSESEVSQESFELVDHYYEENILIKSKGAIGANLEDKGLGFCLLKKSDGRGLYATKDIALAKRRFDTVNPDICVYVVDKRQSFHFQQVFATLELMGFDVSERCYHLAYDLVETKNGPMSSRYGTIVPFLSLIKELEDKCKQNLLERNVGDYDKKELEDRAHKIAMAAIRYGMIKVDPENKIVFDLDDWLQLEGNTGPYLLYSNVRMHSILEKNWNKNNSAHNIEWKSLETDSERRFLVLLSYFNDAANSAAKNMKPNIFANYMYDLAKAYNGMYKNSPIKNEESEIMRQARLGLTQMGLRYFETGLKILGIPTLTKM